jgi:hypothetical protein
MADVFAYDWACPVIRKHLGGRFNGHCFNGIASLIVKRDERLDFTAKRMIVLASPGKESVALVRRTLDGRLKDLLYLLPSLWCHTCCLASDDQALVRPDAGQLCPEGLLSG